MAGMNYASVQGMGLHCTLTEWICISVAIYYRDSVPSDGIVFANAHSVPAKRGLLSLRTHL